MKYFAVLALSLSTVCSFAGTGTSIVTNTPVCVAALVQSSSVPSLPAWAPTNTYAAGAIVRVGSTPALCVVPGISGVTAPAISAVDVADSNATWRAVSTSRTALGISNLGGTTVFLAPASASGKGLAIASGASVLLESPESSIQKVYLSTAGGASTNNIVEW